MVLILLIGAIYCLGVVLWAFPQAAMNDRREGRSVLYIIGHQLWGAFVLVATLAAIWGALVAFSHWTG